MLTREETKHFIENGLAISDLSCKMDQSPLETLNEIIFKFHKHVPFQNISILLQKAGTVNVPDLSQVKEDVLNFRGGLCYTNNVFMKYLLEAIGLKTCHISGVCNPKHPNNHIATIVYDLEKSGQRHLVDVGCGYPTYQAVELNNAAQIYHSEYITYCFKRESSDLFTRYHTVDDSSHPNQKCYDIRTTARDLPYFQGSMLEVYKDRFPKKLRVIQFFDNSIVAFREMGNHVQKIVFEHSTMSKKELVSCQEIVNHISEVLPCFSRNEIKLAVDNWQTNLHS